MENYVLRAADQQVKELDFGSLCWFTSKELGNSETMTTGLCILKSGAGNPRHYHPNCDEVLHVLQGRIVHTLGDDETELEEGDTISVPINVIHSARNIGEGEARLFISFSSAERQAVFLEE